MASKRPSDPTRVRAAERSGRQAGAITISDIAKMAGVSKKSVSRVINDEVGVSPETRERIKSIIADVGFRPNRGARALANSRSFLLALAYNNPNPSYILDVLKGMQDVGNPLGYEVVMLEVNGADETLPNEIWTFMARSGCDGVLLTPPLSELPVMIGAFQDASWSVARIAGDDVDLQQPQARFDDRAAALSVGIHLLELGHKNIAFVGGHHTSGPTRRRLAGLRDALSIHGGRLEDPYIAWGDFTFASGYEAAEALLKLTPMPTAIFCANDQMAAGAVQAVRETGARVPDHVSVVGFDNSPLSEQVWPPLTSVSQPVRDMGSGATELLIKSIERQPAGQNRLEYSHSLTIRESTGAPPNAEGDTR